MLRKLFGIGDKMSLKEYKEYFGDKPRSIGELHSSSTPYGVFPSNSESGATHLGDNVYYYKGEVFTKY